MKRDCMRQAATKAAQRRVAEGLCEGRHTSRWWHHRRLAETSKPAPSSHSPAPRLDCKLVASAVPQAGWHYKLSTNLLACAMTLS